MSNQGTHIVMWSNQADLAAAESMSEQPKAEVSY
jgi:hypothetical protein